MDTDNRLARQTPSIDRRIRNGETVNKSAGWTGQTMFGKTLGVIGARIWAVSS